MCLHLRVDGWHCCLLLPSGSCQRGSAVHLSTVLTPPQHCLPPLVIEGRGGGSESCLAAQVCQLLPFCLFCAFFSPLSLLSAMAAEAPGFLSSFCGPCFFVCFPLLPLSLACLSSLLYSEPFPASQNPPFILLPSILLLVLWQQRRGAAVSRECQQCSSAGSGPTARGQSQRCAAGVCVCLQGCRERGRWLDAEAGASAGGRGPYQPAAPSCPSPLSVLLQG